MVGTFNDSHVVSLYFLDYVHLNSLIEDFYD